MAPQKMPHIKKRVMKLGFSSALGIAIASMTPPSMIAENTTAIRVIKRAILFIAVSVTKVQR